MSASSFKRAKTGGWFPEHPIRLSIVGLPAPSDAARVDQIARQTNR